MSTTSEQLSSCATCGATLLPKRRRYEQEIKFCDACSQQQDVVKVTQLWDWASAVHKQAGVRAQCDKLFPWTGEISVWHVRALDDLQSHKCVFSGVEYLRPQVDKRCTFQKVEKTLGQREQGLLPTLIRINAREGWTIHNVALATRAAAALYEFCIDQFGFMRFVRAAATYTPVIPTGEAIFARAAKLSVTNHK